MLNAENCLHKIIFLIKINNLFFSFFFKFTVLHAMLQEISEKLRYIYSNYNIN